MPDIPRVPAVLPVLSRGKHRSPKRGACFMEMASYLAGERWSDRPSCTHPLLADVARNVNDRTSDVGRPRLAPMIPAVIGLTTDDPRVDARIALHCALVALPVVAAERQRSLAVGILSCQRVLQSLGDDEAAARIRTALEGVPEAASWAARFGVRTDIDRGTSVRRFRRNAAPGIVSLAARGVAEAMTPDHDELLRRMLEGAIDECSALLPDVVAEPVRVGRAQWVEACDLTHSPQGVGKR